MSKEFRKIEYRPALDFLIATAWGALRSQKLPYFLNLNISENLFSKEDCRVDFECVLATAWGALRSQNAHCVSGLDDRAFWHPTPP